MQKSPLILILHYFLKFSRIQFTQNILYYLNTIFWWSYKYSFIR